MSVTFFIEANPTGWYAADCYVPSTDTHVEVVRATSYDAALSACDEHKSGCALCDQFGIYVHSIMDVEGGEVNLANTNAIMMFNVLGIEIDDYDLAGSMSGDEFLGHVLTALATDRDDSGVSDLVEPNDGGATMIHCGLPAGYWNDRLNALHDLAQEASKLGRNVVWS